MNIVTSKKIIASMIIAIMLIGVTSPIFAATTNATVKTKTYIYSSESTGSTKKAEIYKGQTVRVSSINGNWCKISWQVTAYAHKNFVNKNGEVKGGGPNLYSDQKHTKQIGDLKTGKLTILENKKLYDNNYYKVSVNVTGYMKKTDLNIATSTTSNKPASSSSNSSGSTISILSSLLDISFGVASGIFEGLFSIFGGIGSPGEGEQPLKEKTLKLNKTSAEVKVDNTITLTATYNGKTVKPIYKSSNTKIATIDSNGKIKGIAQGETTITATYNGKKATCKVNVQSSNSNKTNSGQYKFTGYYFGNGGPSDDDDGNLGSGVKHEQLKVNNEGWYTYNGKVVLASSTNALLKIGNYKKRDNIHYFNYFDEVTFEYNGTKYTGIILDSCGAAMKSNIMDIRCAGGYYNHFDNTINQKVLTVYYK